MIAKPENNLPLILEYRQVEAICNDALTWYHAVASVDTKSADNAFTQFLHFRLWRLYYGLDGKKGAEVYHTYREAFEFQNADVVKHLSKDHPLTLDRLFFSWFSLYGHHRRPPQSREWLFKHAKKWRDLLNGE